MLSPRNVLFFLDEIEFIGHVMIKDVVSVEDIQVSAVHD